MHGSTLSAFFLVPGGGTERWRVSSHPSCTVRARMSSQLASLFSRSLSFGSAMASQDAAVDAVAAAYTCRHHLASSRF